MAGKTAIIQVDGQSYEITSLNMTPALALYDDLRLALGRVIERATENGGTEEQIFSRIAAGAIGGLPAGTPERLTKVFAPQCRARMSTGNGSVQEIWVELDKVSEEWFGDPQAGRGIGHWQRWIIACLKYQYADFLVGLGGSGTAQPSIPAGVATTT